MLFDRWITGRVFHTKFVSLTWINNLFFSLVWTFLTTDIFFLLAFYFLMKSLYWLGLYDIIPIFMSKLIIIFVIDFTASRKLKCRRIVSLKLLNILAIQNELRKGLINYNCFFIQYFIYEIWIQHKVLSQQALHPGGLTPWGTAHRMHGDWQFEADDSVSG